MEAAAAAAPAKRRFWSPTSSFFSGGDISRGIDHSIFPK